MIIKCPECGENVSTEAKTCPNCGYPIKKLKKKTNPQAHALWKDIVGISVSGVGLVFICPPLIAFGFFNNLAVFWTGLIAFILLIFPFVVSLIYLLRKKHK